VQFLQLAIVSNNSTCRKVVANYREVSLKNVDTTHAVGVPGASSLIPAFSHAQREKVSTASVF
jgi:hypothetical protein